MNNIHIHTPKPYTLGVSAKVSIAPDCSLAFFWARFDCAVVNQRKSFG